MSLSALPGAGRPRRSTATARFGSSRRENHDASAFYERFVSPELSTDETVAPPGRLDVIHHGDARAMGAVESNSVALVVTSPPYFAGKEYEEALGENGVPGSYFEYLELLSAVFAECKRVLEPGGRIAVNVANLGRRPYRSLAGDVATILADLGLLLRGEVVWWKGRAAGGSCAWGTFQRPSNPVLRDVTERIVIASKGRFDRALKPEERERRGLPATATISREEFLEATTDLWEIAPESATRLKHPAPFPLELPRRLIDLYTYAGDLVLDPFMGSGSTAVAAVRSGRHYVGYDTDAAYCKQARLRVAAEKAVFKRGGGIEEGRPTIELPPGRVASESDAATAASRGLLAREVAGLLLSEAGFRRIRQDVKVSGTGIEVSFLAEDSSRREIAFDVSGAFTVNRGGLRRADTLWRALGKVAVLQSRRPKLPLVLLTTDLPARNSAGHAALKAVKEGSGALLSVLELLDAETPAALRVMAGGKGA